METLFTGRHIIRLAEVPSTNTYAMQAMREKNLTEGTLVWADAQTGGRGQFGNSWESEAGKNLTFSLVMHPNFLAAERQFYLSKIASLAVLGTLTEFLPASQYDIQIKWPNDVLVNGKKLAGILIENVVGEKHLQSSVIGVGLNVNQRAFGAYKRGATSVALLLGHDADMAVLLERFCRQFEALYLGLRQGKTEHIDRQYMLNLYKFGVVAQYRVAGKEIRGSIAGVTESGSLRVQSGGTEHRYNFKEIEFV